MIASDKELREYKEKHHYKLKAKTVSVTSTDYSNFRVSDYTRGINKKHVVYFFQEDYKSP